MHTATLYRLSVGVIPLVMSLGAANNRQSVEMPHTTSSDSARVAALFDRYFDRHVATSEFPSAAVVLVEDGRIVLAKGYGFTDSKRTKPVSPDKTVFYAASVSKLFVATAVMQLVDEGKVSLDADVNRYLAGFHLENRYNKPVTLADLLSHTSGLDDHMLGAEIPITSRPVSLGEYFARNTPQPVRPPGEQINYSNHGMALAGYVVEAVSGSPFYEYVERRIFQPLGMTRSTFRQPVPSELTTDLGLQRFPKPRTLPYAVATLVSTPVDMGRFILALLNGGTLNDHRLLTPESVAQMETQHFAPHPHMPGVGFGFFESSIGGRTGLYHTGARDHFSLLYLRPAEKMGLYIVMAGSEDESSLLTRVLDDFLKSRWGGSASPMLVTPVPLTSSEARRFVGGYRLNMIPQTTIEKIGGLVLEAHVGYDQGALTLKIPGRGPEPLPLSRVEPLLFRTPDGGYVAFRDDGTRRVRNMFLGGIVGGSLFDPTSFDKLAWYQSGKLNIALFMTGFLSFLCFLLSVTLRWLLGRLRGRKPLPHESRSRLESVAWRWAIVVSALVILAPISAVVMILLTREHQLYSIPPILRTALSFLLLAAVLGLALPAFAVLSWKRRFWSLPKRAIFTVLALIASGMIPLLNHWNLFGFRF